MLGSIRMVILALAVAVSSSRLSIWPIEMPAVCTRDFSNRPEASRKRPKTATPFPFELCSEVERMRK